MSLLAVEEFAYWDRGVMVANPGVGLPEGNVLALGTDEQKERFLGPFLGARPAALGVLRDDRARLRLGRRRDRDPPPARTATTGS